MKMTIHAKFTLTAEQDALAKQMLQAIIDDDYPRVRRYEDQLEELGIRVPGKGFTSTEEVSCYLSKAVQL